jgi:hypothetical protein
MSVGKNEGAKKLMLYPEISNLIENMYPSHFYKLDVL